MPAMAPTTSPSGADDFDMAKLQKTLKQRQRHAVRNSANVAKLTPAEIRSLNHTALVSKTGSQSSNKSTSSPARSRRSTNATPPTTPDDLPAYQAQSNRNSVSRNNSLNIPTPPHTPNGRRRSSQSSTHGHHHHHGHGVVHAHAHANGVIHAPRPRGSVQAAFMSSGGSLSSRPSSSGSSTYRGLPTYRGPEVTRTGSINMLQYPSQQIVNNPLSYFSRPRQSHLSTSPERSRTEQTDLSIYRAQSLRNTRANSLPYVSAPSSRQPSPPRVTDSPVSMIASDPEKFPAFDSADDPHNQPKTLSDDEEVQKETELVAVEDSPKVAPPSPDDQPKELPVTGSPKREKDKQKRFTIHAALFGADKGSQDGAEKKLKKIRRRTLSFHKSESLADSGAKEIAATNPSEVVGTEGESGEFVAHPAIRPLSVVIPTEDKGKQKEQENEVTSAPVYSRCACCGKVKRPHGYNSGLSPVMENENLRTNFSFEVDRTSGSSGRRSSDASRTKFTPIIPMAMGEETRQARIEPWNGSPETTTEQNPVEEIAQSSPVRQPLHQNPSPVRMKRNSAPPRFVRFASLHGRRNGDTGPIAEEDEELEVEADENQPLMTEQDDLVDSGIQTQDFARIAAVEGQADDMGLSEPLPDVSSAARAFVEPLPIVAKHEFTTKHAEVNTSKSSATPVASSYHTPARGATPDTEYHTPPGGSSQKSYQPSLVHEPLPEPSLLPYTHIASQDRAEETSISNASTAARLTIITPPAATNTMTDSTPPISSLTLPKESAWERELTGAFLTVDGNGPNMDLTLRPKFSFESMRSANMRAEMAAGQGVTSRAQDEEKPRDTVKKRRSLGVAFLGGGGVAVKA